MGLTKTSLKAQGQQSFSCMFVYYRISIELHFSDYISRSDFVNRAHERPATAAAASTAEPQFQRQLDTGDSDECKLHAV